MKKMSQLLANSRFYILATSLLLSILIAALLRAAIPGDELYYIRVEQVFGFVSVIFLYVAVILTPLSKLLGKKPVLQKILFARRAFGVSAAYFAILHVYIVMAEQIGGLSGLGLLPSRFVVSFILGFIALVILFLMASTSFDKAIELMTFKRWKQLHRFVYLAGVLVIIHIWMIGTHAETPNIKAISILALALLFGLEAKRIANTLSARFKLSQFRRNLLFYLTFVLLTGSLMLLPVISRNYHSEHHDASQKEATQ